MCAAHKKVHPSARALRKSCKPWKRERAKELRANPTPAERALWPYLRARQLGLRITRQALILGYIVDFWCPNKRLAIEIDGASHNGRDQYDAKRTKALNEHGITVMRFTNDEVLSDPQNVICSIIKVLSVLKSNVPRKIDREP